MESVPMMKEDEEREEKGREGGKGWISILKGGRGSARCSGLGGFRIY